jgi:uroporphyrinogen III methyltransferase/synthase
VAAYTTRRVEAGAARLKDALAAGVVDAVTFTSSSTARNFAELFTPEERRTWLERVVVASIGPVTAATAAEYGLTTQVIPRQYTIPALAEALVAHLRGAGPRVAAPPTRGGGRSE